MSESVELALAVLHGEEGGEIDPAHFGAGFAGDFASTSVADALDVLAGRASSDRPTDRFAVAQGLALGQRLRQRDVEHTDAVMRLAAALVGEAGVDDLLGQLADLEPGMTLTEEALAGFGRAFGDQVSIRSGTGGLDITGPAAGLVTLLIELLTADLRCRSRTGTVDGRPVLAFEIDSCTNLPFDRCSRAIDPRRWPDCSPMFISVLPVGPITTTQDGWTGVVREVVGIQGYDTFTTDLAITYRSEPGLALTSYDLAPQRGDDGRVTVDRGFVSATDEGVHRRMRALKVYRVEGLETPPSWVCPLWTTQVVLAGWWCG